MAIEDLKKNEMMAHLIGALDEGKDIGHYGRLVFAMVAHHFLSEAELVAYLRKDPSCSEKEARSLVAQVEDRDYNPPRRETILDWQGQQDFPIIPNAEDPDAGNVYEDLEFPEDVYDHISEYHLKKHEADAE